MFKVGHLIVLLGFFLNLASAQGASFSDQPKITVMGEGTVYAEPDLATVTFGIGTQNADLEIATKEANSSIRTIREALSGLGVEEKDIRTSQFQVWPQEEYDREGKATGERSYIVNHMLTVKIREVANVGKALSLALAAGANSVSEIQYSLSDQKGLEQQARTLAMTEALQKAQQLAQHSYAQLWRTLSVEENSYPIYSGPSPYAYAMNPVGPQGPVGPAGLVPSPVSGAQQQNVPLSSGELGVKVMVTAVFSIIPSDIPSDLLW
ncbi:MAG: SIMPL domain-containing protein [Deinococcales bacterium]